MISHAGRGFSRPPLPLRERTCSAHPANRLARVPGRFCHRRDRGVLPPPERPPLHPLQARPATPVNPRCLRPPCAPPSSTRSRLASGFSKPCAPGPGFRFKCRSKVGAPKCPAKPPALPHRDTTDTFKPTRDRPRDPWRTAHHLQTRKACTCAAPRPKSVSRTAAFVPEPRHRRPLRQTPRTNRPLPRDISSSVIVDTPERPPNSTLRPTPASTSSPPSHNLSPRPPPQECGHGIRLADPSNPRTHILPFLTQAPPQAPTSSVPTSRHRAVSSATTLLPPRRRKHHPLRPSLAREAACATTRPHISASSLVRPRSRLHTRPTSHLLLTPT